jgi:O-antigen/teichoic acid export membrane protein
MLPFDIVMASFCTVLLPYITTFIAEKKYERTQILYKAFLEISYISTAIFVFGSIVVAPELMTLLYTEKYLPGISIFIVYMVVDLVRFLGITLILSAAGKTKKILYVSIGSLVLNLVLNFPFYFLFGIIGPAIATLIVTFVNGIVMLSISSREIGCGITRLFDWKFLLLFALETTVLMWACAALRMLLVMHNLSYLIVLVLIFGVFCLLLGAINLKRMKRNIMVINNCKAIDRSNI